MAQCLSPMVPLRCPYHLQHPKTHAAAIATSFAIPPACAAFPPLRELCSCSRLDPQVLSMRPVMSMQANAMADKQTQPYASKLMRQSTKGQEFNLFDQQHTNGFQVVANPSHRKCTPIADKRTGALTQNATNHTVMQIKRCATIQQQRNTHKTQPYASKQQINVAKKEIFILDNTPTNTHSNAHLHKKQCQNNGQLCEISGAD